MTAARTLLEPRARQLAKAGAISGHWCFDSESF